VVTVAANLTLDGERVEQARLALNAVGPHPLRARATEEVLQGATLDDETIARAAEAAMEEVEPYTDAVASEWYRRRMVGVYVGRALGQIAGEEG
jgi:CO/xanthine dehydrogenase FAD-binding subunit